MQFIPNARLMVYLNYGGDYIGRDWTLNSSGKQVGYGTPSTDMSGCNVEVATGGSFSPSNPAHCGGNNKDVQEFSAGYWYQTSTREIRAICATVSNTAGSSATSGPARRHDQPRRRRQWHRQHVLDLLPLLPPVTQPGSA